MDCPLVTRVLQAQPGDDLNYARLALQASYQSRILAALPTESTADLELTLWKYGFYHHIDEHRQRCKPECAASPEFRTLLDQATAFYLQLLREIQSRWSVPGLFFVSADPLSQCDAPPQPQSQPQPQPLPHAAPGQPPPLSEEPLAACHRCLMQLGDLARYTEKHSASDDGVARTYALAYMYYEHARVLRPAHGAPHNQLAVLAAATLPTPGGPPAVALSAYHLIRAARAPVPFPTAAANLARHLRQMPPISTSGPPLHPLLAAVGCLTGQPRALDAAQFAWAAALEAPSSRFTLHSLLSAALVFQHCVGALGPPGRLQLDCIFIKTITVAAAQNWPERATAVAHLILGWLQVRLQSMPVASDLAGALTQLGTAMAGRTNSALGDFDSLLLLPEELFALGFACERPAQSVWLALDQPDGPHAAAERLVPTAHQESVRAQRIVAILGSLPTSAMTPQLAAPGWGLYAAPQAALISGWASHASPMDMSADDDEEGFEDGEQIVFGTKFSAATKSASANTLLPLWPTTAGSSFSLGDDDAIRRLQHNVHVWGSGI